MNEEQGVLLNGRARQAIDELVALIVRRYPTATFELTRAANDPTSIHLLTTVDVDDADEVGDLVVDRVVELQADEQIPIHVIPIRTPNRVLASLRAEQGKRRHQHDVPVLGGPPRRT